MGRPWLNLPLVVLSVGYVTIEQIKSRLDLLNKIISAFKEAEASGIKDPIKLMKKALKKRANLNVKKSNLKKLQD